MEQAARIDRWICRRQAPRFRIGMPARLITLEQSFAVTLEDLSEGGAKVTLPVPHVFTACALHWMDYHAIAEVRWTHGCIAGLQFTSPLFPEMLDETRRYAPDGVTQVKLR